MSFDIIIIHLMGLAMLLSGCSLSVSPIMTDIATPSPAPADTVTSTSTLTPTWTLTPEPTSTPMATSTPTVTYTPTIDWSATPTQQTHTPSIIEVTPLGGGYQWATPMPKLEAIDATYTPNLRQNVRAGPGIDYPIKYLLSGGQPVQVYAWVSDLPEEAWLCLDEGDACADAVALRYADEWFGELEINK